VREKMPMRDRVESGAGGLFVYGLALGASWFWHQHTSAPSLWWGISGVLTIGSVIGVGRNVQLMLSGFSGFGRNYHEEREPLDPSPDDESYDHDAVVKEEASHVWGGPGVLFASGVLASAFRMWPEMMTPDGVADPDFIPYDLLVLWVFVAGFGVITWTVLVLVMMKAGPDRWAYVPGARQRIRSSMWKLLAAGVVLVAIATAFTITSGSDSGIGEGQVAAESIQAHMANRSHPGLQRPLT
jgi:hypothetical protein